MIKFQKKQIMKYLILKLIKIIKLLMNKVKVSKNNNKIYLNKLNKNNVLISQLKYKIKIKKHFKKKKVKKLQ